MNTKLFQEEIQILYDRMCSGQPFAFSKFADGEWMALNGVQTHNNEWVMYDNYIPQYSDSHIMLSESFRHKHPDYYVGISCRCCQGDKAHEKMKEVSGQNFSNLTFANVFVNANYKFFIEQFIPFFTNTERPIVLVANQQSDLSKLPFKVSKFYGIHYNAWVNQEDLNLINEIHRTNYHSIILYSAGPFGNIAIHQGWKKNQSNQYIDIVSTIDRWLDNDKFNKRCYGIGNKNFSEKVCVW